MTNHFLSESIAGRSRGDEPAQRAVWRALTDWPHIRFIDDREGNQFKVIILRSNDLETGRLTLNEGASGSDDLKSRVFCLIKNDPEISYPELAERLKVSGSTVKRLMQELKHESRIRRIGAARGGFWEVL